MRHRDGHVVWIRDIARLCQPRASAPFWRGVLIDITAERSAQTALDRAQASHRVMVDRLPACVYRAEPRAIGSWEYVSAQIEPLLGYTQAEWLADPTLWRASLHADDRERVEREEDDHASAAPGAEFVSEYRLRHRSGRLVWVRDRAVVTRNAEGLPMIDGILTDISAERAAAAGAGIVADVYRLTCGDCGSTWAADRIERCRECGGSNIESVSLNSALSDLAASRQQVEGLLDGIQKHLEALGSNLRSVSAQIAAEASQTADD
jgi:PAS domain S-box-containing protein